MKLSDAIEGYKIAKRGNGMSENTLLGYQNHFNQLIEFVENEEIEKITQDQLIRFMIFLREDYVPKRFSRDISPYKSTTIRNAWCAVRSLFGWAHRDLGIERPDLVLKMPKVSYPDIQPFTQEELQKIIKAAVRAKEMRRDGQKAFRRRKLNANRNKAIVLVLLDTGIRVSECVGLRVKDVNFANGEVFIRPLHSSSKNRSRTLRLGTAALKAVWLYLSERSMDFQDDPLFLTNSNRPMTRSAISSVLERIGKGAGVEHVYPHRFRHTFAIQFLRNLGDVFTLQHALGHTDWTMTRHYSNLAKSDFSNVHRRASPVDNWRL
jgi:integrase/recombinase XerD